MTTTIKTMIGASSSYEADGEASTSTARPSSTAGAGPANHGRHIVADMLLGKQWNVSFTLIAIATVGWIIFERSGLPLLSICSDVLLILIGVLFVNAKYEAYTNKQLQSLPGLALSEEMVHNVAASVRDKINYVLLLAHDITLGKKFGLCFKVVACLWLLSVAGSYFSFVTLAYIGGVLSITLTTLYSKHKEGVDNFCGTIHRKISKLYGRVNKTVTTSRPQGS